MLALQSGWNASALNDLRVRCYFSEVEFGEHFSIIPLTQAQLLGQNLKFNSKQVVNVPQKMLEMRELWIKTFFYILEYLHINSEIFRALTLSKLETHLRFKQRVKVILCDIYSVPIFQLWPNKVRCRIFYLSTL